MQVIDIRALLHRVATWDGFTGSEDAFRAAVPGLQTAGLFTADEDVTPDAVDFLQKLTKVRSDKDRPDSGLSFGALQVLLHHSEETSPFPVSTRQHRSGMEQIRSLGLTGEDRVVTAEGQAYVGRLSEVEFVKAYALRP